jgi:hypothetical protein
LKKKFSHIFKSPYRLAWNTNIFGSTKIKNGRSIRWPPKFDLLLKPTNRLFYQFFFALKVVLIPNFYVKTFSQKFKMAPIWRFFWASFSRSSGIRQKLENAKIFAFS